MKCFTRIVFCVAFLSFVCIYRVNNGQIYTTFSSTYRIIAFMLVAGFVYPNPKLNNIRIVALLLLLLSISPLCVFIFIDIYKCLLDRDLITIIRHSTVIGPFLGSFLKIIIMHIKNKPAMKLIDEINRDYHIFNSMPASYQHIINASIKNNLKYSEKAWAITVVSCVMIFPVMAIVLNVYNFTFKSEPTKYMIHDLRKPFSDPEDRFKSPYFEIMFVYMFYCAILYVINFTGYDGFFGLSINHACLKMQLYCHAFEDALRSTNLEDMQKQIFGVIKEQNRLFKYVELIQETFNIWLGVILIATMIQICNCMYHITEGYGLDLRYIIFIAGTIVHIYLPCRYSAKLQHMSLQTATLIYCAGWEHVQTTSIRKMVIFMIARAQIPLEITAFNILIFDMDLFVSILQTSYSMYTLIRS